MSEFIKIDGQSRDVISDNISRLKELFPEIITERKIDFDKLRLILGDEVEDGKERYEFTWPGKKQAVRLSQLQSTGTLRPDRESSKNFDTTKNLYIEGDNLEVLRLMQQAYYNKIKMIYIDPPYNTGNDFVYNDDFKDNVKNYIEKSGEALMANPETSGRFHSNWLNMMYPRLRLARNLLREDGVIFINIDDHETDNLKKICNEVMGEENFVANVVWQRAFSPKNDSKYLSENHDYILIYSKNIHFFNAGRLERSEEANRRYGNPDNDPRGEWMSDNLTVKTYSEKYDYPIITPSGRSINPAHGSCWRVSKEKLAELIKDNRIWFGADGNNVPRLKRFLSEVQNGMVPTTLWLHSDVGHNQEGRQELKDLFDGKGFFDGPKPVKLLCRTLKIANVEKKDLILDFFSGSATTAHAVMKLNAEDGGSRQFIMVQLPELTTEDSEAYKAGYKNICEIGKERIRSAGVKLSESSEQLTLEKRETPLDVGFKVFKLDTSNIKEWDLQPEDLEGQLDIHSSDPIKEGRSAEDVVYEIMLKFGIDLTLPMISKKVLGKTVFDIGHGALFVCMETGISLKMVEEIAKLKPMRVVFRDSGFDDDNVKLNAAQILKKFGVAEMRSI